MTELKCRDCKEPIQFLPGDKRPYDLTPRIHYANPKHIEATKRPKKSSGGGQVSSSPEQIRNGAVDEAVAGLVGKPPGGLGFKVGEAKEMVGRVPATVIAAGDVAQIMTEALKRRE